MTEELRPGERWEWGVKHSQGIRNDGSEAAARASLEWLRNRHKRSRPGIAAPQLVRRRVSDWQPVDGDDE